MSEVKFSLAYEAEPVVANFHASDAFVRGLMGPIGCLSGDAQVITEDGLQRIDSLTGASRVLSWDESKGQFRYVPASASFPKGKDALYRVRLPHGEWRAAGHHRVLCADGKYRQVKSLAQDQSLPLYSSAQCMTIPGNALKWLLQGVRRLLEIPEDLIDHCVLLCRLYGQPLHPALIPDQDSRPSTSYAQIFESGWPEVTHTHLRQPSYHRATMGYPHQKERQQDGFCRAFSKLCARIGLNSPILSRFLSNAGQIKPKFYQLIRTYYNSITNGAIISIERCAEQEVYWDLQVPNTNNYVTADGTIHHNSGKSVGCTLEMFAKAVSQEPYNGVRRTRWAAVRNTYPELKSTTIKTFEDWFPPEVAQINWAPPITAHVIIPLPDGTKVDMEVMFLALDKPNDAKKLLSLELTGVWLNEVREIPKQILEAATGRVARYPAKRHGGPTWSGLIMDTNPPDDDHWYYTMAEEEQPDGYEFFHQPPAMIRLENGQYLPNPNAENIGNLPTGYDYYIRQIPGKDQDWINVYIMGLYGSIFDGKPVYPEYNDAAHCGANDLEIYKGMPLYLGWDYGLTPACVAGQMSPHGQLRIVDEWCAEDMGIREFARDVVKPCLMNEYAGMKIISVGDPAGKQRSQTEQTSCMQILAQEGIPTVEAPTNEVIARLDSVRYYMGIMSREGSPGFIISPRCRQIRRGFNGGYKYERVQVIGEERYKDVPAKNKFSHPHDALQYLCAKLRHGVEVIRQAPRRVKRARNAAGWT